MAELTPAWTTTRTTTRARTNTSCASTSTLWRRLCANRLLQVLCSCEREWLTARAAKAAVVVEAEEEVVAEEVVVEGRGTEEEVVVGRKALQRVSYRTGSLKLTPGKAAPQTLAVETVAGKAVTLAATVAG